MDDDRHVFKAWRMAAGSRRRQMLTRVGLPVAASLIVAGGLTLGWFLSRGNDQPADKDTKTETQAPDTTADATPEDPSTPEPVIETPPAAPGPGPDAVPARLIRISDPDSLIVALPEGDVRVRLLCVEGVKLGDPGYAAALAALKGMLPDEGSTLLLETDPRLPATDSYNVRLRYVWVDGVLVNAAMVRAGHLRYRGNSSLYDRVFRDRITD